MLDLIKSFLLNMIIVIMFVKVIELILPKSNLTKYINLVIGIITLVVLIAPIAEYFEKDFAFPNVNDYYPTLKINQKDLEKLDKIQAKQVVDVYKQNLENNIQNIVTEFCECTNVKCEVDKQGNISEINIYVENEDENLHNEIIKRIGSTYNVEQDKIKINGGFYV